MGITNAKPSSQKCPAVAFVKNASISEITTVSNQKEFRGTGEGHESSSKAVTCEHVWKGNTYFLV